MVKWDDKALADLFNAMYTVLAPPTLSAEQKNAIVSQSKHLLSFFYHIVQPLSGISDNRTIRNIGIDLYLVFWPCSNEQGLILSLLVNGDGHEVNWNAIR